MIVDDLKRSLIPVVQPVSYSVPERHGVNVYMARLDLIVPFASGNKIYKLVGSLDKAVQENYTSLLSFGGAFSNHIHALALTAQQYGLQSIGIIRGEEVTDNPTLKDARDAGMQIINVDRTTYRRRSDSNYLRELQRDYPDALIIPEGGANKESLIGTALIPENIKSVLGNTTAHTICCAAGTGATAAGIGLNLADGQELQVYTVVRDDSIEQRMADLMGGKSSSTLPLVDASFGGYGKFDEKHLQFILDFLDQTGVLLDPIYTSKLCRKVMEQIEKGTIECGENIVLLHTGGLQGWRGFQSKVEKLAGQPAWLTIASHLSRGLG